MRRTHVLTVSSRFPSYHRRVGQPTFFRDEILAGRKIHTIRENADWWMEVAEKVNAGKKVLSIREWSGKPYASKQTEITQFTKIGVQKVQWVGTDVVIGPHEYNITIFEDMAANDGLQIKDFLNWFKYPEPFTGVILHFTDFRYGDET